MIHAFQPVDGETNLLVDVASDSAVPIWTVDLTSSYPVMVPAERSGVVVDRSQMQTNAMEGSLSDVPSPM